MKNNSDDIYRLWLKRYRKAVRYLESYKQENGIYELDNNDWLKLEKNIDKDSVLDWILEQRNIINRELNLGDFDRRLSWEQIELLQKVGIIRKQEQFTMEEIDTLLKSFADVYWGYKCPVPPKENDIKEDFKGVVKKMAYHLFVYVNEYYFPVEGQNFTLEDYICEGYLALIKGIRSYNSSCGDYSRYLEMSIFEGLREKFYLENAVFKQYIKFDDRVINELKTSGDISYHILMWIVYNGMSLSDIGRILGVSRERVRQIYNEAIDGLSISSFQSLYKSTNDNLNLVSKDWFNNMLFYFNGVKGTDNEDVFWEKQFGELEYLYGHKMGNRQKKLVKKVLVNSFKGNFDKK